MRTWGDTTVIGGSVWVWTREPMFREQGYWKFVGDPPPEVEWE